MTLAEYLTANLHKPFSWETNNCISFLDAWLWYATGRNDLLDEIPAWTNATSAMRIVKSLGGLQVAMDERFKRIEPNAAHDGDIALVDDCLALFSGAFVVGPGETGLMHIDRLRATAAWSLHSQAPSQAPKE